MSLIWQNSMLERGHGLLAEIDRNQECPNERFRCRDCHFTGELTVHGKCARCNSDSVESLAVVNAGLDMVPEGDL